MELKNGSNNDPPPSDRSPSPQPPGEANRGTPARLLVIPLVLVILAVFGLLSIIWFTGTEKEPQELVRAMQQSDRNRWKEAYALSELLRNPAYDALKDDGDLCRELASILAARTRIGGADLQHVRFRVFLCRSLGEFRLEDGLPALIEAALPVRNPAETDVRYAALEAIAVLAGSLGPETIRGNREALEVLLAASREPAVQESNRAPGELQSTAAYALGVVGGARAETRLVEMLDDPHPNVRYNAATGLARHGVAQATGVLLEMLDEQNPNVVKGETTPSARALKRAIVLVNGIRAAVRLVAQNPSADREALASAVQRLSTSNQMSSRVRMDAKNALLVLHNR